MTLSLVDLFGLPSSERTDANIILNIPSLKRKCDLFYHLTDKEAFRLLKNSELIRASPDMAISEAFSNLCILLKGKVSFCHKTHTAPISSSPSAETDKDKDEENEEKEKKEEKKDSVKGGENTKNEKPKEEPMTAERRRTIVLDMVSAVLEHRKNMQDEEKRMSVNLNKESKMSESCVTPADQDSPFQMLSRFALYGKTVKQYSDGSYFGGPSSNLSEEVAKNDTYTYVADTNCVLLVIPVSIQEDIVNHHYLNTIQDKESMLVSHHISRRLTKPQQSALLHEMLEEHFIYGNLMTRRGFPADTVYFIKSGFARLYLDVKIPKVSLPEAVQHLPSTQLQQRLTNVKLEVMDLGPGEFIGGLEQLTGEKNYMFNIEVTCKTVAYNIRGNQFRDLVLKEGSKSLQLFIEDLKAKWRIRREMADFKLCPEIDNVISKLLGEDNPEEEGNAAHLEALKSELVLRKMSVPYYMLINVSPTEQTEEVTSMRPPNRGPFADRVRNRMLELGFKSRRGIN